MKSVLTFLLAACVFALGCYAAVEWPRLRAGADSVLEPVYGFVEAPSLAEARLAELRSLETNLAAVTQQLDGQAQELAHAYARTGELAAELAVTLLERDQALEEARRADDRFATLCQAIRALDLAEAAE